MTKLMSKVAAFQVIYFDGVPDGSQVVKIIKINDIFRISCGESACVVAGRTLNDNQINPYAYAIATETFPQ